MDKDNNSIYTVLTEEIKKENSSTIKAKLLYILNNKALDEAEKKCDIEDIAIKHKYDLLYRDIDNKINPRHLSRLFDITTDRIIIQISGTCTWIHHHSVIHGNGRNGRYARHDCLGTPGIPRKIMEFHIPKTDSSICLYNSGINIHRCTG